MHIDLCSVIITSYQREHYILNTVNSVYNQTYRPIELIVIEDGSTDNTFEILEKWGKNTDFDEGFSFVLHKQSNTGAPVARNRALEICNGEFIQEIGSDDLIHPRKLEIQIKYLKENPRIDSAWNPLQRFTDSEEGEMFREIGSFATSIKAAVKNLFIPQFMPSAALHRRHVFMLTGLWNPDLKRWQDFEYQVRMMQVVKEYVEFNIPLYFFRQHNKGRVNDMYKSKEGISNGLKALYATERSLPEISKINSDVRLVFRQMYISLLLTSFNNNSKESVYHILSKIIYWSDSFLKKLKFIFLYALVIVLPIQIISKAILNTKNGK